ncbi:MAG: minor capsid protein [Bacillota bacterium]
MKILDLINFIKTKVSHNYFPNKLPSNTTPCASVKFTSGSPTRDTFILEPSFQILLRGSATSSGLVEVENKAYAIHNALTNLKEQTIGSHSVVIIRSMQSLPMYIGDDENGCPIYSLNFDMVVRP